MGWINDKYFYSVSLIKDIADNWGNLYDDWASDNGIDDFSVAEHRADFCIAFKKLPRRMQTVIREYLRGTPDRVMEQRGYYEVKLLRDKAFRMMVNILNGEQDVC
jgi:hypothetical protein